MWNVAADAEINDDLIAAGLGLPDGVVTPTGIGCEDGHAAEVYYRHLVPPGTPPSDPRPWRRRDGGCGCGPVPGMRPVPGELPATADLGSGKGLSTAAADLVKIAVARAVQHELQSGGAGRGTMPAGIARWAARQLAPAVVPWPKVLRAAVRRAVEDQAGPGSSLLAAPKPARTLGAAAAKDEGTQDRRRSDHRHVGVDGRCRSGCRPVGDTRGAASSRCEGAGAVLRCRGHRAACGAVDQRRDADRRRRHRPAGGYRRGACRPSCGQRDRGVHRFSRYFNPVRF